MVAGNLIQNPLASATPPPLYINVPPLPGHALVGREKLLDDLAARLLNGASPALSTAGMAGVGKTTLAVALAHDARILAHFRDGVLWAGLGLHPDIPSIQATWATALGVDLSATVDLNQRAQLLDNAIGQRQLLLVIDDAWQSAAALLLRSGGPHVGHLLTTRDGGIARAFAGAMHAVPVLPLDDDPAFQLLALLAPEACQQDEQAARHLVQAVGGLPLAVELLGGYLATPEHHLFPELSQQAFAELADPVRRLHLATVRLGGARTQQETLEASLQLSLTELAKHAPAAVTAFYALGAFAAKPARFARAAAETVAQTDAATLALLAARNLVEIEDGSLALHQTLADVARARTPNEALLRHRDVYLALVDEDRNDWQRIEAIYPQLTYSWQQLRAHGLDDERYLDFIESLSTYQIRRGLWQDHLAWLHHSLAIAQHQGRVDSQAHIFNSIGMVYDNLGKKRQALKYYEQALLLVRQIGDCDGDAAILNNMGTVFNALWESRQALICYEQALSLVRQKGDQSGEAAILNSMGAFYRVRGNMEQAIQYYKLALPLYHDVGNRHEEAVMFNNMGLLHRCLGDIQQALSYYEQSISLLQQIGAIWDECIVRDSLAQLYFDMNNLVATEEQIHLAVTLAEQIKHPDLANYRQLLVLVQKIQRNNSV